MADRTGIEWTDATWNPVTGCTEVSPGCDHCYARTFAERWRGIPGHYFEHGFDVQLRPYKLTLPLSWRRPRRVFVNSMSDLFHDQVPDTYIARVFAIMAATPEHTYQVLTKRHGRMRSLLSRGRLGTAGFPDMVEEAMAEFTHAGLDHWPLPNVWLGVSVEDQKWADLRVPALLETPAAVRFLSCEPLLGPVDLLHAVIPMGDPRGHGLTMRFVHGGHRCRRFHGIDWVIVGGESGPGARPMHPKWARLLRDQCTAAGVPFFFKQWGEWSAIEGTGHSVLDYVTNDVRCQIVDTAGRLRGRPCPGWRVQDGTRDAAAMRRYGKHAAGRVLDGRTWDEFPHTTTTDGRRSA